MIRCDTPSGLMRLCLALMAIAMVLFFASLARAQPAYDAIVSKQPLMVDDALAGLPWFATVNGALNAGFSGIAIKSGDYYEKLVITRDGVSLTGVTAAGETKPRIYFDAYAGQAAGYHRDNWGTPGSATVMINAVGVSLHNLRIDNTFDFLANDVLPKEHPAKKRHSQAVALLLDVASDLTHITDADINGFQDTVFADGGRSLFERSRISGNVDFIFGDGLAVFLDCEIHSRRRGRTFEEGALHGYITAPSTNINQPYGLVFVNAELTRDADVPDSSVSLGRPWHPTTTFADGRYADPDAIGSAIFIDSELGGHIIAEGWSSMRGTARDGTKSRVFTPAESRFYESNSRGPGAVKHAARRVLDSKERAKVLSFIDALRSELLQRTS